MDMEVLYKYSAYYEHLIHKLNDQSLTIKDVVKMTECIRWYYHDLRQGNVPYQLDLDQCLQSYIHILKENVLVSNNFLKDYQDFFFKRLNNYNSYYKIDSYLQDLLYKVVENKLKYNDLIGLVKFVKIRYKFRPYNYLFDLLSIVETVIRDGGYMKHGLNASERQELAKELKNTIIVGYSLS